MVTDTALGNTYAEGYKRRCPSCEKTWTNGRSAIQCWYQDDPEGISMLSLKQISDVMGLSDDTVRSAWRWLETEQGAITRSSRTTREPGEAYDGVLRYLKQQRAKRHGRERGWSRRLSEELGVSRQRIHQLAAKAKARADI